MPEKETKPKTYTRKIIGKRVARIMAVQALYTESFQEINEDIDAILYNLIRLDTADFSGPSLDRIDESLMIQLARGACQKKEILIKALQEFLAENWQYQRLPKVIQSILLVAAFELKFMKDAEAAIIINEYLEISKSFNHEGEVGFVNQVLDKFNKKFLTA
jgi:N utilization substance protein B